MGLSEAINGTDLADEDESTLLWGVNQLQNEIDRRATLQTAEQTITDAQTAWRDAAGRAPGEAWVQPAGSHDVYPKDWEVVHGGKTWVSLVDNNVWEPGVSGWREKTTGGGVPEWVAPSGGHDAYQTGDRVRFQGDTWESLIDANVWSPAAHPAGWRKVT